MAMEKIKIVQQGAFGFWIIGWLFTIGYVHLSFWYGVLAVIIWPYFLGARLGM